MTDNDKKDKIILRSIPDSCHAVVDFGAGEVNALIDTGAEIMCIRPEYLPQGEGEIVPLAKVKLCCAYASQNTTEATLVNVRCRLMDGGGDYPFSFIQAAVSKDLSQPCCISFNDYKVLSELALTAVPNGPKYHKGRIMRPPGDEIWMEGGGRRHLLYRLEGAPRLPRYSMGK